MRQYAYLIFNPIMVENYAAFFNSTPVGQASASMMTSTFSWLGPELFVLLLGPLVIFFCSRFSVVLFGAQCSPSPGSILYL